MDNDPRYVPIATVLPTVLPAIDRKTARRYAEILVRRFGRLGLGSPNQSRPASLSDWGHTAGGRRCWASTTPTDSSNHFKGWGRLIHDVSHIVFSARHPSFRPHDGGHATLEREIAEYVVRKGWLEPKPKIDPKVVRAARLRTRLQRWESKAKRAQNAIKKLRRTLARYETA